MTGIRKIQFDEPGQDPNQNSNPWDQILHPQDEQNNNDYYGQNNYDEEFSAKQHLISWTIGLGAFSLVSTMLMTVFLPLITAPLAILFGIFSKGKDRKMDRRAKHGVTAAIIAICINLGLVAFSVSSLFTNTAVQQQMDRLMQQMYGVSLQEFFDELEQSTGIAMPDVPGSAAGEDSGENAAGEDSGITNEEPETGESGTGETEDEGDKDDIPDDIPGVGPEGVALHDEARYT